LKKRTRSLLVITLLILGPFVITQLALAAFGGNTTSVSLIQTGGLDAGYPAIALSQNGQNLGVVYAQTRDGGGAIQGPIYFRGGNGNPPATLSGRVLVDNSNSVDDQSLASAIAGDPQGSQTNMHIVWQNLFVINTNQINRILYTRCTTNPITCGNDDHVVEATIPVTDLGDTLNDPAVTANASPSAVAAVHVVWQHVDLSLATRRIWYSARNSSGSWTAKFNVSGANTRASRPAIAASRALNSTDYVHVVWVNDSDGDDLNEQVRYSRGTVGANGNVTSWTAPISIGPPAGTTSHPDYPAVAALGDTVIILWDVYAGPETNLDGPNEPVDEQYFAVYSISTNNGSTFSTTARDIGDDSIIDGEYDGHRSDNNTSSGSPPFGESTEHASRLQIQAELAPTAGISGTLHVVWHQTTDDGASDHHDVWYIARPFAAGDNCGGDTCEWTTPFNETDNEKAKNDFAYSASPDIAIDANSNPAKLYALYMEGDQEAEFDVDNVIYNVYYQGTVPITVAADGGTYLPIVLKNSTN